MEFSAEKVPRNMAMIDENGEPVITRTQPPTRSADCRVHSGESPAAFLTSPL